MTAHINDNIGQYYDSSMIHGNMLYHVQTAISEKLYNNAPSQLCIN